MVRISNLSNTEDETIAEKAAEYIPWEHINNCTSVKVQIASPNGIGVHQFLPIALDD